MTKLFVKKHYEQIMEGTEMQTEMRTGTMTMCGCGKVKGLHGWLTLDKLTLNRLIQKAASVHKAECDECAQSRMLSERLQVAAESCTVCLE